VTTSRFVGDLWHEVTSVDSATVRSLRSLLTRPGELTRDYLAGRTRWYLSPLRLYMLMFAVLLCGQALLPDRDTVYVRMEALVAGRLSQQQRDVAAQLERTHAAPTRTQRAMLQIDPVSNARQSVAASRFVNESPWLQLINAVTWGGLLTLLFRGRRRNFAEHLVFAMHLLAFNVVLILANAALRSAIHMPPGERIDAVTLLHWCAIGGYFFLASRRLYGESRGRAVAKSTLFVAGAQLCMVLISVSAYAYAGFRQAAQRPRAPVAAAIAPPPAPARTAP
jgi:hypothetical protein